MIAWDFRGPDIEDSDIREAMNSNSPLHRLHRLLISDCLPLLGFKGKQPSHSTTPENDQPSPPAQSKHISFMTQPEFPLQNLTSPAETTLGTETENPRSEATIYADDEEASRGTNQQTTIGKARSQRIAKHARSFLIEWLSPRCLGVLIGLVIALISPVKALFTPVPSSHIPNAPDGQPPLAFILDTTVFIGNASVPLGLICLGSALARMRIPRGNYRDLPLGAISSLAIGKLILMPIFGFLVCQGLAHSRIIDPNDKVLRFVCMCALFPLLCK
jgi:hypothetical protein